MRATAFKVYALPKSATLSGCDTEPEREGEWEWGDVWEVYATRGHKWCHHNTTAMSLWCGGLFVVLCTGEWRRFEGRFHKTPSQRATTLEPLSCGVVDVYELITETNEQTHHQAYREGGRNTRTCCQRRPQHTVKAIHLCDTSSREN